MIVSHLRRRGRYSATRGPRLHVQLSMSARLQLVTLTGVLFAGYLCVGSTPAAAEPPRDLDTYVLLGVHAVNLGRGTFVAAGNVGVNEAAGTFDLHREVFVAGGLVADVARVGHATSVDALFVNQLSARSDVVVRAADPTPFTAPIVALPPLPGFAPSSLPVSVRGQDRMTLAPGAYGAIEVGMQGILELTGGAYEFASLDVNIFGAVLVDAPATINVQGDLKIGRFGRLGAARTGVGARDVRVTVGGESVRFGDTSHAAIDLFAPNAHLRFGRSFRGEGRFVGNDINGRETMNLRLTGVGVGVAASRLSTLTQDHYGAPSGGTNSLTALVSLNPAILPVTVGAPGISSLTVQDAPGLVCFLPASGAAASLCLRLHGCAGDTVIDACGTPPILDFAPAGDGASGGQGGGAFVGEVIAAKLNVALADRGITEPGLAELVLPTRLCTTKCPSGRVVNPNPMIFQTGAVGVADGLSTVGGLLALADQALSVTHCRPGTCSSTDATAIFPPNPIRMSDIQNALRVVNECFQGGATLFPCD